jgi:hypothetical protein
MRVNEKKFNFAVNSSYLGNVINIIKYNIRVESLPNLLTILAKDSHNTILLNSFINSVFNILSLTLLFSLKFSFFYNSYHENFVTHISEFILQSLTVFA